MYKLKLDIQKRNKKEEKYREEKRKYCNKISQIKQSKNSYRMPAICQVLEI